MEIIRAGNRKNNKELARKAAKILKKGGIVIFPTETAYGLGVDAQNQNALQRLQYFKGRAETKIFSVAVSSLVMARRLAVFNSKAKKIWQSFMPGPLTVVLEARLNLPSAITYQKSIGIRYPDNDILKSIIQELKKPITATSANISGQKNPYSISEIKAQYGKKIEKVDLIIDAGVLPFRESSTVVDVRDEIKIIRQGAITKKQIQKAFNDKVS